MTVDSVFLVGASISLAALLGTSDAANATAALISARSGSFLTVAVWSIFWHILGGLLAGTAVAETVIRIVQVKSDLLAPVLATSCLTSVVFTWIMTQRGIPASASVGLVGGLAGAGVVAGGWGSVDWGGVTGWHLVGVVGVLLGILISPIIGSLATALVVRTVRPFTFRLRRKALGRIHLATWMASAAVAFADGTNDGQKAMGIMAVGLSGVGGVFGSGGAGISLGIRIVCATVLALFTVISGRKVIVTVSRGLSKASSIEDLAAQTTSACVILTAAAVGVPLSTSTVVTASMVGAGLAGRRRHIHWRGVVRIVVSWLITVPVCAALSAGFFEIYRTATR